MVGISLAPKRTEAMTQIATSIEHKKGQLIPELHFKPAPFKAALRCIRAIGIGDYGRGADPAVLNPVRQAIVDKQMSSAVQEVYHTIIQAPLDRGTRVSKLDAIFRELVTVPPEAQRSNQKQLDETWNTIVILELMQWLDEGSEPEPEHESHVPEGAPPGTDESIKVITCNENLLRSEEAIRHWLTRLNDIARIACFFASKHEFEAAKLGSHIEAMFDNLPEVKVRLQSTFSRLLA
jgi:hypothetical protein